MRGVWRRLRKILFMLLYAAVLTVLAWFIGTHLNELQSYDYELRPAYLVAALIVVIVAYIVNVQLWRTTSIASGITTSWIKDSKAWILSRLGRYVPGKVPVVLLRLGSYSVATRRQAGSAMIVEAASTLFASTIFILSIAVTIPEVLNNAAKIALVLIAVLAGALSFSNLVPSFGIWLWKRFGKDPEGWQYPSPLLVVKLSLGQVLVMLLHGSSLFLVLNSVSEVSIAYLLLITGIYYFAGLLGIAALFAPGGLGVREGALLAMLQLVADVPTAIVATVLIRIVATLGELTLAAIVLVADRCRTRAASRVP